MQTRKPLPESLMAAVRAVVADETTPPAQRFEAVVLMVHGYGLFATAAQDEAWSLDPVAYAVPREQSMEIANLLADMGAAGLGRVNLALDWMNVGPSSYEEGA
jgi:hypothetical protein